ncbi:three-helix bundle dimerization domain-containing protein [Streptomyces sp. NPDC048419]|uniref:three-helix bundle dimerization domain-containing protein n=1 Tax=Streptomyces sp. NPDC048419 TaxID=3365547 RepID=UPI00371DE2A7
MAEKNREEDAIRGVVERLKIAFSSFHSAGEIETVVAKAHATFSERPVREFIPVLVERRARAMLNDSSA